MSTNETKEIKAWAAYGKSEPLKDFSYTPRPLGEEDVEIKISHCGICGSDVHQIDSGWGDSIYPMVPGHEIVGEVTAIGPNVKELKVGQRVGVGAQCASCGDCEQCNRHEEQLCRDNIFTYNSQYNDGAVAYGGYAQYVRVHSTFVFAIPDNLPSEAVAPLFCAGITTYSPLIHYGLKKGEKLGIIGIGGLGHLGIQWGVALGADVTAISTRPEKEPETVALGAHHFLCSTDKKAMSRAKGSLDFVLSTVSAAVDWEQMLGLLKPDGKFIMVGLPEEDIRIPPFALISPRLTLGGSLLGSPTQIKEMLKLASEKNIVAKTQLWPIEKVNDAIAAFREGKPKYRYVLKISQ